MTHSRNRRRPQPLWLRVATFACVLLVGVAGIAQAAHIHGDWLPQSAPHVSASTPGAPAIGEDSCPLCVAMHSALPGTGFAVLSIGLPPESPLISATGRKPETQWHFAAFSRPPPQR
jgi:hypothetical protein